VRDNIAAFGGDPDNVTIFGESSGGWKVSLLMAMPGAKGLFHKAIVQSGPGLRAQSPDRASELARALLARLSLTEANISRLAELPAAEIHAAATAVTGPSPADGFAPCLDAKTLPRHPFDPAGPAESIDVPLMIGTNKDESTLFQFRTPTFGHMTDEDVDKRARTVAGDKAAALIEALRTRYPDYSPTHLVCAIQTVSMFWANSIRLAERKAAQGGAPAFVYELAWETPVARGALKTPHALEIPLVFDNVEVARNFVGPGEAPQIMADHMATAWLAFARTGAPETSGLPSWPAYDAERRATMIFDLECRVEFDPKAEVRRILAA
ncbi:MAG TPA: carboxylesterase family protein, partial [Caulobacteraceae bacterium]